MTKRAGGDAHRAGGTILATVRSARQGIQPPVGALLFSQRALRRARGYELRVQPPSTASAAPLM
jgi:hypothetical protein